MNRIGFIFICSLYFTFSLFSWLGDIDITHQIYISLFAILTIGIPHGALDNTIFLKENNWSHSKFYAIYVAMMLAYVALWFILPIVSLIVFVLLSAYHFGQSQFSTYPNIPRSLKIILYTTWGISILSGLIFYNNSEILTFLEGDFHIHSIVQVFDVVIYKYLSIISTISTVMLLGYIKVNSLLSWDEVIKEVLTLVLIHISFYLLPVIIGFTLYFVILHSAKVLVDEYEFLKINFKQFSLWNFVKMLLPITAISVVFLLSLILSSNIGWLPVSNSFLALILISIFTLPHSIVMELFYERMLNDR